MAHMTRVLRGAEFIQTTSHIKDVWGGIEANSQHSRDTLLQVELKARDTKNDALFWGYYES